MQRRRYGNILDRKRLYIIGGIVLAVLIIILIIVLVLGRDKDSSVQSDDTDVKLKTNAVLPVNQLIDRYYEAKKACDATTLMSLIYPSMTIDESELQIEAELVEDYGSVVCYTLPGLSKDSYVVWVEFEYKFYEIDKTAPALNRLYAVKSTETGEYQIYSMPDEELLEYMEKLSNREDIKELSAKVEERLQKALESDEKLRIFYEQLSEGIVS